MSGSIGWGIGLPRGPQGLRADVPPPSSPDDIHAIRERYVQPKVWDRRPINLAANQAIKFDLTGESVNGFILTVATGQINVYQGDQTSQSGHSATVPDIVGSAAIAVSSQVFTIPPGTDWIFTAQEGTGGTATGTIIFMYM